MCRNCSVVNSCNFICGHQHLLWRENSKFCLFHPHTEAEFHMTSIAYESATRDYACYGCQLKSQASKGELRGAERQLYIASNYERSIEKRLKEKAQKALAQSRQSQLSPTATKDQLMKNAKSQIKYYLGKPGLGAGSRITLLKVILQAPRMLDLKELVTVFGSYAVWDQENAKRVFLEGSERNALLGIARRSGFMQTLKDAMAMKRPVEVETIVLPSTKKHHAKGGAKAGAPGAAKGPAAKAPAKKTAVTGKAQATTESKEKAAAK